MASEREIFDHALTISDARQRAEYLQQACGQDESLREHIEGLLEAHARLDGFLEKPPLADADPTAGQPITESPGAVIGPYKLLEKLGEGGFGVVYMAEQAEPVERRVALKIIKPGMDSRRVISRFKAEEQALAIMDHPNIARVFDAGITGSGRPYFVMELVKGVPITEYCDAEHLTPRQRLELFIPVCHAVQHAHQKGIIHRDLKPSNVLVALYDDKPAPKVIDFGVAKATSQKLTEQTKFTQYGQLVGTLEYMSPEQANLNQLDIDTRSDIYSLGVLLYELLTGETPFDRRRLHAAAFDELLRIIREEEPPRPSLRLSTSETLPSIAANRRIEPKKLSTLVRGELDWIVMKALEKDRSRRYETANALADDIERYLNDEPVEACPPSAAYRFRKFVRRNKVPLAVVSAAALILVSVAIGAGIAAARFHDLARRNADLAAEKQTALTTAIAAQKAATEARDQETEQRAEAERQTKIAKDALEDVKRQRERAEANFSLARSAVDEFLNRVTENELLTVPGLQPLRQELLSSALKFYEDFARDAALASELQVELAAAYSRIAAICLEMDDGGQADDWVSKSIELFEKLRDAGNDTVEVRLGLAKAIFTRKRHLGVLHSDAAALCQSILETHPKHAEARRLLADMYHAAAFASSKNIPIALEYQQQALALCEGLVQDFPDNPEYLGQWGSCLLQQGNLLAREGKNREALAMDERAVDYFDEAYRRTPNTIRWGRSLGIGLQSIADKQAALGNLQQAVQSYERLVAVRRKLAFDNPAVSSLKIGLYKAYLALGKCQERLGNAAAANRSFRAAQEVLENIPCEEPDQLFELATVYGALAATENGASEPTQQDREDRQRYADLAMEMIVKAVDRDFNHFFQRCSRLKALQSHENLAVLRQRADFQQLVGKLEKEVQAEQLAVTETGTDEQKLADRRQAIRSFRELIADDPRKAGHRTTLADTLQSSGELQIALKQYGEAEKSLQEALEIRKRLLEEHGDDPHQGPYPAFFVLAAERSLGLLAWSKQDYPKAHQRWRTCLAQSFKLAQQNFHDQYVRSSFQSSIAVEERRIYQHYGGCGLWPLVRELATRYALPQNQLQMATDQGVVSDAELSAVILGHNDRRAVRDYFQRLASTLRMRDQMAEEWRSPDFRSNSGSVLHAVRGIAALGEGDLFTDELLARAKSILKENRAEPINAWSAVGMAMLHYHQGRYAEARSVLEGKESRLQVAFLSAAVASKLGDKKGGQERWSEAEGRYRQLCRDILAVDACENVAQRCGGSWWEFAYDQAMRRLAFETTVGAPLGDDPWQRLIQARGYWLIGEKEKAEENLAAAVVANPKDWEVLVARARLFAKLGETDRARADWQRAVDLAGDDSAPWIARSRWYAERGEREKADADYAKAVALAPDELTKFLEAGWWIAGPYPPDLDEFCPAEIDPDPANPVATVNPHAGLTNEPIDWRVISADSMGRIHLSQHLEKTGESSVYLLNHIYSPGTRAATFRIHQPETEKNQANVSFRVWVNGSCPSPITEPEEWKFLARKFVFIPAVLRAGRNTILVKARGSASSQSLALRLDDHPWEQAFDLARAGLLEEAADLVAGEHVRMPSEDWHWLWSKYPMVHLKQPAMHLLIARDSLAANPFEFWAVATQCLTPEGAPDADLLRLVADQNNRSDLLSAQPWRRGHIGLIYVRAGRWQDALTVLGEQYGVPLQAIAHHHLGNTGKSRELLERCFELFRSEVEAARADRDAVFLSSSLCSSYSTTREAHALIAGNTDRVDALYRQFQQARRRLWQARDPATAVFDDLVRITHDQQPQVYLARARLLAELERWDEAEADLGRAANLAPNDPGVPIQRARFSLDRDMSEQTVRELNLALQVAESAGEGVLAPCAVRIGLEMAGNPEVFDALVARRPDGAAASWLWFARMFLHAHKAEWEAAQLASQQVRGNHASRAAAALLAGDNPAYQQIRDSRLANWEPGEIARLLQLAPTEEPLTAELLAAAQEAARTSSADRWLLGIAQFRARRFKDAVAQLEGCIHDRLSRGPVLPVLAMACHGLAEEPQARKWLDQSDRWMDLHRPSASVTPRWLLEGPASELVERWLAAAVFHREARQLIAAASSAGQGKLGFDPHPTPEPASPTKSEN